MKRPSDDPLYGTTLEIVDVKAFLDDLQALRASQKSTPVNQTLSELFSPTRQDDPLFARSAPVIDHLRALPEPFRSQLLAKLVSSLPPDHITNLERLDPTLIRMLRHQRTADGSSLEPDGIHAHPYMSNVQYTSGFFTSESDPVRHTPRHDGRYFVVSKAEEASLLPEGLPGGVEDEFAVTQRRALMVRAEVRGLVNELERYRVMSRAWAQAHPDEVDAPPMEPAFGGKSIAVAAELARAGYDPESGDDDALDAMREEAEAAWEPVPEEVEAEAMALALDAAGETSPRPPACRVFTGVRGIGKSCALFQVVRYARAHGWIVVYVPSALRLTHQGRVLTPTRGVPGDYDQNDLATELLSHVLAAHADALGAVPQRGSYAADAFLPADVDEVMRADIERRVAEEEDEVASLKAEAEARGEPFNPATDWTSKLRADLARTDSVDRRAAGYTLRHMAEWGLAHPPRATEAAVALLEELRLVQEFPVLVAVDGVNDLYEPSGYPSPYGRRLNTKRLPLVRALQAFDANGEDASKALRRGTFIGAASMARHKRPTLLRDTPPGGSANVPAGNRLEVLPMSRGEVHAQLLHYAMTGRFPELPLRADIDSHSVEVFRTLSSGVPLELRSAAIMQF